MPRRRSGRKTLSSALAQGSSVASWNTKPTSPGVGAWPPSQSSAAGIRAIEPGDQAQQRRFTAAGGAEQGDEVALVEAKRDVAQGLDPAREAAAHRGDGQHE